MRLNKKGMSMVEIMVSIVLISIILIFLMNLFINVRATYNQSKIQSEYHMLESNIINAVGKDIEEYDLQEVNMPIDGNNNYLVFTFKSFRESKLSDNVKKVLEIDLTNNVISYSYVECTSTDVPEGCVTDVTSEERLTNVVRSFPEDSIIGTVEIQEESFFRKIKVPISDAKGNIYDINIFGVIEQ